MRYVALPPSRAWNPPAPRADRALTVRPPPRAAFRGAVLAGLLGAACGLGARLIAPGLLTESLGAAPRSQGLRIVVAAAEPVPAPTCATAQTLADELVCADPALAAADQRLALVWREAIAAGVPAWRLRRGQERWLAQREDAAYEQPQALPELYRSRIDALGRLIPEDGSPPRDGPAPAPED